MPHFTRLTLVACAVAALSGCAVTSGQVGAEANKRVQQITAAQQSVAQQARKVEPSQRVAGNYVGGATTLPIAGDNSLPATARDVLLAFGAATGSLDDVARNIRVATGIPVRINPDVVNRTGSVGTAAGAPSAAAMPGKTPLPPLPSGGLGAPLAGTQRPNRGELPLSFQGDLADYLTGVAATLAINWDYADGEIRFFRKVTRSFTLLVSPGSLAVHDDMNSGSQSTGGAAQQAQAGSFNGNSTASADVKYDPWASIDSALKTMISPEGKYTVDQAAGALVVTDTKEVTDRVAEWVKLQNAMLTRQVAIEVREIAVQTNKSSEAGIDLNLVYQRINQASGAADWLWHFNAPSSLTSSGAGSVGFNIARPDSRLSGSNIAVQALNALGTVVSDTTRTVVTTNRVPGRLQDVTDRAYLAETTPAAGGTLGSGGTGVPGLKPGVVTYGDNLILLPTIGENNVVLLQLFSQRSTLLELNSVTAGSGQTFQQINTPVLARRKNAQNFQLRAGETLVIVGNAGDTWTSSDSHSVTGGSFKASRARTVNVLLVTPRVMQGA